MASRGRGGLGLVSSLMEQDGSVESGSVGRSLRMRFGGNFES